MAMTSKKIKLKFIHTVDNLLFFYTDRQWILICKKNLRVNQLSLNTHRLPDCCYEKLELFYILFSI
jgi:hypothetical protein